MTHVHGRAFAQRGHPDPGQGPHQERAHADGPAPAVAPDNGGERTRRLLRRASYASVGVALTLIAVKAVAWWLSGSVSLLSSLVDSTLDAGASVLTLIAVAKALKPADDNHRFGHGKAESLSALAQAAIILVSAVLLAIAAAGQLLEPAPVTESGIGIAVMVFSIVLTGLLLLFQRHVTRATGSPAIAADSLHYASDLLTNLGVIIALLLAGFTGLLWADGLIALAIAVVIAWGAAEIAIGAVDGLMDRELPEAEQAMILKEALAEPEILAVHDLRTRRSGRDTFIQLHIELPPTTALIEAHRISDAVALRLKRLYPNGDVMIHQDPVGADHATPRRHLP